MYVPQTVLALRGSYLGCTQLALDNAFLFGCCRSRRVIPIIQIPFPMANAIKPMFLLCSGWPK